MRGNGKTFIPMSARNAMPPEQMATLVTQVVERIISLCGPADAIMVSVAAVKIIGELARHECGEAEAQRLLIGATEKARAVRVQVEPLEPESDPFVIEPSDPFSIPE